MKGVGARGGRGRGRGSGAGGRGRGGGSDVASDGREAESVRQGRGKGAGVVEEEAVAPRRSARFAGKAPAQQRNVAEVRGAGARERTAALRVASVPAASARIVTGFGSERVDDVVADERRRVAEGAWRGDHRREEGTRGRMTSFGGEELDRAAGGAWHAGRR